MDLELFLKKLASDEPAPGGGTASAIAGSMGAALLAMVAKLSSKTEPSAASVSNEAERLMETSNRLAKEDEKAFESVVAAYKLPKQTEKEKSIRAEKIEETLKKATQVPLQSALVSLDVLKLAEEFVSKANKNAISDIGVAALLAKAAAEGAILNVFINLASLKDNAFVKQHRAEAEKVIEAGESRTRKIMQAVYASLRAPAG